MGVFRFIHASDLHFSTTPDIVHPYDSGGARGALDALFKGQMTKPLLLSSFSPDMAGAFSCDVSDSSDIDAVIITGDLATTGFYEDLSAASDYFLGRIREEWSTAQNSFSPLIGGEATVPLVIMPGNHDRYTRPFFHPRSNEFEHVFGAYWNFSNKAPKKFASHKHVRTRYLRKGDDVVAICAVDFSLNNITEADQIPFAYMGQGRVVQRSHSNEAQLPLDELVEQTQSIKDSFPLAEIIWCVHFPPKFPQGEDKLRLINEGLLLSKAQDFGIKLMLSGHTHKYASYVEGGVRVICCGTTTGAGAADGNHYLEITVDTVDLINAKVIKKCWSERISAFV